MIWFNELEDFRYKPELFDKSHLIDTDTHSSLEDNPFSKASDKRNVKGSAYLPEGVSNNSNKTIKNLKDMEKEAIIDALERCNGKRKEAAGLLGIPIRTLYEKIKRYGIQ